MLQCMPKSWNLLLFLCQQQHTNLFKKESQSKNQEVVMKEHSENIFLMQTFFTNTSPKIFSKTYHDLVLQLSAPLSGLPCQSTGTAGLILSFYATKQQGSKLKALVLFCAYIVYCLCNFVGILNNSCPVAPVAFAVFLNLPIFCAEFVFLLFFFHTFSTRLPTLNSLLVFSFLSFKPMKSKFHWNR